jgi:hypothetical protein
MRRGGALMKKGYVVAVMLAVVFLGAFYAVISFLKKNEAVRYDSDYTWHAEYDSAANADILVRGKKINHIKNDAAKLIIALNRAVEKSEMARPREDAARTDFPRINLRNIEQQTANVEIVNDRYLTQDMGSSGAQDYLAEVTYTLTENPGIKSVNFIFQAGDHAMPGIYGRESFTSYRLVVDDNRKR